MSDSEKLINASDLIEWIIESDPDWCVGAVRSIVDHVEEMPSAQPEPCEDTYGYIAIETLLAFCENSKDHAVTPNDFMRMKRVRKPEPCEDAVSRKTILKFLDDWMSALEDNVHNQSASDLKIIKKDFENLPSAEPQIIRCKDCKHWHSGSCEYPEHVVNSQDYYVGDIETEAEHFCGYAKRKEVTT